MTTTPATSEATPPGGVDAPATGSSAPRRDLSFWLRWCVTALGAVTAVLVVTGLHLTLWYRPASRIDQPDGDGRSMLVSASHALHNVGAYAFVGLVCVVVGIALVVTSRRNHAAGIILASGFGLFIVAIAFLLTGFQLPWRGFVWVAGASGRSFDGVIGFPREVVAVLVGTGEVNPSRYETVAWIHIAGLPVFGVFAAWWMLGTLQANLRADAGPEPTREAAPPPSPSPPPPPEPARPVTLAERLFGTDDPGTVRLQVDAFLTRHVGCGIAALDFTRTGSGIILGVTLDDGRPAVVRLYPPGADAGYLRSVQDVQLHLVAEGFPAPRPLVEPVPFGVGLATVEGRLHEPPPADPADPAVRRSLAAGLAAFVRIAAPLARHADLAGRGPLGPPAPGSVFPEVPGAGFDFAATAVGAEWIEDLGARARSILDAAPDVVPVVGHFGWRVENVALSDAVIVGLFDWSQVGSASEAIVIGSAAHQFTIDGRSPRPHVPDADEIRGFVADYEAARATPLTNQERVAARAAYVYCTAYGARCEHVLAATGASAPGRFRERLASTGAALLA